MLPSSRIRTLVVALAVVFFFIPVALRAVGVTAEPFENRRLAERPRLSQGWDVFDQATRFLVDRMPLREEAVRANTWLSKDVFGTAPRYGQRSGVAGGQFGQPGRIGTAPRREPGGRAEIMLGRDGWLFLKTELSRACRPFLPFAEAARRWARLVAAIRTSGRRVVLVVVPDKSSIYPEYLPRGLSNRRCAERGARELSRVLAPFADEGVVDLRAGILEEKRRSREPVYLRKDSHWTQVGSLLLARRAVADVGGGIEVRDSEVRNLGPAPRTADLTVVLGSAEKERGPRLLIERRPGAPRVKGRTLYLHDSFGAIAAGQLDPYFEELRQQTWDKNPPARAAREIAAANTVVLEIVQREFTYRTRDDTTVNPRLFELLRKRLAR